MSIMINGTEVTSVAVNGTNVTEVRVQKQGSSTYTVVFKNALASIYGVDKVGSSDPNALERTDDAIGLSYTRGISKITSDFDNCYPWSDMQKITDSHGNVFIKIPKFYSKITKNADGTYKHQISGTKYPGFSTLFVDGKGNEINFIFVGKYEGSYNSASACIMSKSGQTVKVSTTRSDYRTACMKVGKGYQQYDFLIDAIIKELFLIEFATTNSQSVMVGYTNPANTAAITTGRTDSVNTPSGSQISNTDGKHACEYRGIENLWGNTWTWVDGINFNNREIYVCEDPTEYADEKYSTPYSFMTYRATSNDYLKTVTPFAKNPLLGYATAVGGGVTTYYSDYYWGASAGTTLMYGGGWNNGETAGLWNWAGDNITSYTNVNVGGRLCYKPPFKPAPSPV